MAEKSRAAKNPLAGAQWDAAMWKAKEQADVLRQLLQTEWTHPDGLDVPEPLTG